MPRATMRARAKASGARQKARAKLAAAKKATARPKATRTAVKRTAKPKAKARSRVQPQTGGVRRNEKAARSSAEVPLTLRDVTLERP